MALGELLLSLVVTVAAAVGSMVPFAAWSRTREPRFLLVGGGSLALLALGVLWTYGEVVAGAPDYAHATTTTTALTALAAVLWLLSGLVPRRP